MINPSRTTPNLFFHFITLKKWFSRVPGFDHSIEEMAIMMKTNFEESTDTDNMNWLIMIDPEQVWILHVFDVSISLWVYDIHVT